MDDPRPQGVPHTSDLGTMGQNCVDQSPCPVSIGRVHDHAGRLVYRQEISVLVDDVQRDGLRTHLQGFRRRDAQDNRIANFHLAAGFDRLPIDGDQSIADQPLYQ